MAQMREKSFEALARSLGEAYQRLEGYGSRTLDMRNGWYAAVSAVADTCQADNPRFQRDRFLKDCGIEVIR
jgi:hypothetical protein